MRRVARTAVVLLLLAGCVTPDSDRSAASTAVDRIADEERVDPATAAAIDAALDSVYAAISGPVGQQRDWDAMRALFLPDARLTAITAKGPVGGTIEDYIAKSGPVLVESGFTERQLARRLEVYGNLAHAWSSYEGTFTGPSGELASVRGVNSFQFARQADGRWLVQSIFWQQETPGTPLPDDLSGQ